MQSNQNPDCRKQSHPDYLLVDNTMQMCNISNINSPCVGHVHDCREKSWIKATRFYLLHSSESEAPRAAAFTPKVPKLKHPIKSGLNMQTHRICRDFNPTCSLTATSVSADRTSGDRLAFEAPMLGGPPNVRLSLKSKPCKIVSACETICLTSQPRPEVTIKQRQGQSNPKTNAKTYQSAQ